MKHLTLLSLAFFTLSSSLGAQEQLLTNCNNPTAQVDLDGNAVRARITNGGDLWWDGNDGHYFVDAGVDSPSANSPTAMFAGGLWMAGRDPGGGLKIVAQDYGRTVGRFDYFAGPLTDVGTTETDVCDGWDRLFKVTRQEIDDYLSAYDPDSPETNQVPTSLAGWPAIGNPLIFDLYGIEVPVKPEGMAPFFDSDNNGLYDPRVGDYPLFCGEQAVFAVFNDAGNVHAQSGTPVQIQMEIHLLAYAVAAADDNPLQRTTFYSYTLINRAAEDVLDFYAGHWVDVDLGCYENDQIASDTLRKMFVAYNDGPDDGECLQGITSYGTTAPATVFKILDARMQSDQIEREPEMYSVMNFYSSAFGSPPPGIVEPSTAIEYYNYLTGFWRDGTSMNRGGFGYDQTGEATRFVYDGGEVNDSPWLECNELVGGLDFRTVYSTGPYDLLPGQFVKFTLGVTTVFGIEYEGDCPDLTPAYAAADAVQAYYDEFCKPLTLVNTKEPVAASVIGLETYPNPTSGELTFELPAGGRIVKIGFFDIAGRRLAEVSALGNNQTLNLKSLGLKAGAYVYRLQTADGQLAVGRVVVTE
ncbi:MAG: hypothetical protein ACJAZ9_000113 [Neolewinella sp.]|jgi:hypothetical protein